MTQTTAEGQTQDAASVKSPAGDSVPLKKTVQDDTAGPDEAPKSAETVSSSEIASPSAEHVMSDYEAASDGSPKSNSPSNEGKNNAGQRRRPNSSAANTAALLADPASLLECEDEEGAKKTQCSIPFQRSTFLVVEKEPKSLTKSSFRYEVWNYMEKNNIAAIPRPVVRRIPNFKESEAACDILAELPMFKNAQTVVVGPDRPQQRLRYLTLKENKTLLVPSSRLASGLLYKITPPENATDEQIVLCSTNEGVRTFSKPVGLADEVKVDLVVMGSAVVSRKGRRLGKGEGFADLEWAMMACMGAVSQDTTVITCVHDCQIKEEMPDELFQEFDLSVDVIVTPTQTLIVENPIKKPTGIYWSKLTERKFDRIPIMKQLRESEKEKGVDVTLAVKPSESKDSISYIEDDNEVDKSCQTIARTRKNSRRFSGRGGYGGRGQDPRNRHLRKRRNFQREQRRRDKSATEEEGAEGSNKASAGSGDAANIIMKRMRQKKNQRRQRNLRKRQDSRGGPNNENDPETGDTSGKGEENSGAEDGKPARHRNRGSRRSETDRNLSESEGGGNRGSRGRRFNGGYPPFNGRAPPPWFDQYMGGPQGRYNGFYPPPPMRGNRYGYRDQGFYGPPPPFFMNRRGGGGGSGAGGGPGGPQGSGGGRPNEFYPSSNLKPAVFVGDIPEECGEDMFGDVLLDRKVRPERMIWQKNENRTFLVFNSIGSAEDCVRKLKNLYINDEACRVDLSNMTKRNYYF